MTECNSIFSRYTISAVAVGFAIAFVPSGHVIAQQNESATVQPQPHPDADLETPLTRLKPIGAPSAVDKYRQEDSQRHTVRLMQFGAPQLPPGSPMSMPTAPTLAPPVTPPTISPAPGIAGPGFPNAGTQTIMPPTSPQSVVAPTPPRGLPMTTAPALRPVPSSSDMSPLSAPQLNDGFATIDNCCCVSAPSDYVAATGWGNCANVAYQAPAPQAYIAPTTQVVGPSVIATPTVVAPVTTTPVVVAPPANPKAAGIPKKPLLNFGQDKNPVVVGQGLVGQPVAYVPGQRFRNWMRYIFP